MPKGTSLVFEASMMLLAVPYFLYHGIKHGSHGHFQFLDFFLVIVLLALVFMALQQTATRRKD